MKGWVFLPLVCFAILPMVLCSYPFHPLAEAAAKAQFTCGECTLATDILRDLISVNATQNVLIESLVGFCIKFRIENASVCSGIVNMFQQEFFFILHSELSAMQVCGWFFEVCPAPNVTHYNVTFPKPKPPHVAPTPPSPNSPRQLILHISDVHFDDQYEAGMNNECGEPLCCRAANGWGNGTTAAGVWGDYQCDLNLLMLQNLLSHWENMPVKPDFVFWTGDNPPHDIWMQNRAGQINNSAYLAQELKRAFGSIPVFPSIGNHESVPVNSFPVPPLNAWLLDALADQWSQWLPADAIQSFRYAGYYVTDLKPGFKVASLNMNYCNNGNGWLLLNNSDPAGELEWFIDVLQAAEDAQEKVYVIGHIPPGNHVCLSNWGYQFYQIVDRYEDTIIAQFYGHTHTDQFEVFYELNSNSSTPRATSIAYIVPSVTTYQDKNPSYRIYEIDSDSGYLTDTMTYHVNLTQANYYNEAEWVLEYNATSAYNLSTLFAPDWADLVDRLEVDSHLFQLYAWYEYSGGRKVHCDSKCAKAKICQMRSATSELLRKCQASVGLDPDEENKKNTSC